MHRNPLFLTLIALFTLAAFSYGGYASWKVWQHVQYDRSVTPIQIEWRVVKRGEDAFQLMADYRYLAKDKEYRTTFIDPAGPYQNPWLAQDLQKRREQQRQIVWYCSSVPERSTLQKKFPTKECVSGAAMFGLLIYFVILGAYVNKRAGNP